MSQAAFRIVLLGVGTVGGAVLRILQQHSLNGIEVAAIVSRNAKQRLQTQAPQYLEHLTQQQIFNSWDEFRQAMQSQAPNQAQSQAIGPVHAAIELMGGIEHTLEIYRYFLQRQIPVITANKALLAEYGSEIFPLARQNQTLIACEASCGGGIPILQTLLTGLRANRIHEFHGVLNGTCNYILWQMATEGRDYQDVLAEAQADGLAEADPFLDISGTDTAHKLAILSMMSFGISLPVSKIPIFGLETVSRAQILAAKKLGLSLKLLASAWLLEDESYVALRVGPCFIAEPGQTEQQLPAINLLPSPLASLTESFNGISFYGNNVGHIYLQGRGAGASATASAILSDLYQIQTGSYAASFAGFDNWPEEGKFTRHNAWTELPQNWLGFVPQDQFSELEQQARQYQMPCTFLFFVEDRAVVLLTQVRHQQLQQLPDIPSLLSESQFIPILQTPQELLQGELL